MATKPPVVPTVSGAVALMQKARSRGRGRRSPVMVWMQQNREELEAAFSETAPAWDVMASYLGSNGIMDGEGKPPSAQATRAAWRRVKAEAEAKAKASPASPSPTELVKATAPALAVVAPAPAPPTAPQAGLPAPPPRFPGPATLRNHTPAAPPEPSPPPMPVAPRQDSKAVIAELLSRGRPTGFRKPEPQDE